MSRDKNATISRSVYYTIIASLAAVAGYCYYSLVLAPSAEGGLAVHKAIIQGDILSPYRYRVLVPRILNPVIQVFSSFTTEHRAFLLTYGLFGLICFLLMFLILSIYLDQFFYRQAVLTGILFVAASLPIPFLNAVFQPWGLSETVFFTLALILIYKKRLLALGVLTVIATLNRETAIFIPFIYLFATFRPGSFRREGLASWNAWLPVILFFVYLACWAAIYGGLRLWLGQADQVESVSWLWEANTQRNLLIKAAVNISLFMGAFWLFAVFAFRKAPSFLRRTALVMLIYIPVAFTFGIWYEVRLLMPLYGLIVPLALCFLYPVREPEAGLAPTGEASGL